MFAVPTDLRSKDAMLSYLSAHPIHHEAPGRACWAQNVRLSSLDVPAEYREAVRKLDPELVLDEVWHHVREFEVRQEHRFTMVLAGRSNGWMHLNSASTRETGAKSRCVSCGATSMYRAAPLIPSSATSQVILARVIGPSPVQRTENECHRCGAKGSSGLRSIEEPLLETVPISRVFHAVAEMQTWDITDLRDLVRSVQDFDATLDAMTTQIVDYLRSNPPLPQAA
jgi:ribosomal protein S14